MIDDEKMTSNRIVKLLENRHSGSEWAFLSELRTCTGYLAKACYIDCYAAGLWEKTRGFIAYEIKVSRSDFLKDIKEFNEKQGEALANSTQFFYVCPHKMIEPSEVPEVCGLMWANAGGVVTKKVAQIRELKCGLSPSFVASLMRAISGKKEYNPLWKYLGKEISENDIKRITKELYDTKNKLEIDYEVSEQVKKINAEGKSVIALERIRDLLKLSRWGGPVWSDDAIESICKKITDAEDSIRIANRIKGNIDAISRDISSLSNLLKDPEQETKI